MEDDRCFIVAATGPNTSDTLSPEEVYSVVSKRRAHHEWNEKISKLEDGKRRVKSFVLYNGKLYKETFKDRKNYRRLCVPVACCEKNLQPYPDDIVSAHLGKRTLLKMSSRFFWPKMNLDITRYVQSCVSCQGRKGVPDGPPGFLQCIKAEKPFEKMCMDLLGSSPLSDKDNKMIIVAVDYLTKWVELKTKKTGKADDVAEFFVSQIFLRHGAPEKIITDRGKCFVAKLTQAVGKKLHNNHKTTSSYHPQATGAVERMNHTLAAILSM